MLERIGSRRRLIEVHPAARFPAALHSEWLGFVPCRSRAHSAPRRILLNSSIRRPCSLLVRLDRLPFDLTIDAAGLRERDSREILGVFSQRATRGVLCRAVPLPDRPPFGARYCAGDVAGERGERFSGRSSAYYRGDTAAWRELTAPDIEAVAVRRLGRSRRLHGQDAVWTSWYASDEPWEPSPLRAGRGRRRRPNVAIAGQRHSARQGERRRGRLRLLGGLHVSRRQGDAGSSGSSRPATEALEAAGLSE